MDDLDGVWRRCFAPDAQSASGASLRAQATVGWRALGPRDLEKRTRRALLREQQQQQQQLVTL